MCIKRPSFTIRFMHKNLKNNKQKNISINLSAEYHTNSDRKANFSSARLRKSFIKHCKNIADDAG